MDRTRGLLWAILPVILVVGAGIALSFGAIRWYLAEPIDESEFPTLTWIAVLSGIGACAFLEIVKRLIFLRGYFHTRQLQSWMKKRIETSREEPANASDPRSTSMNREGPGIDEASTPGAHARTTVDEEAKTAFDDFVSLALGTARPRVRAQPQTAGDDESRGEEGAVGEGSPDGEKSDGNGGARRNPVGVARTEFLNAPTEQLAAQLSDVGEVVLFAPAKHRSLALAFVADAELVDTLSNTKVPEPDMAVANAALQRGIEAFQIIVAQRWRRSMQLSAVLLAGVAGFGLVMLVPELPLPPVVLLSLVMGGFLSWVVRDITAGIARWRDR